MPRSFEHPREEGAKETADAVKHRGSELQFMSMTASGEHHFLLVAESRIIAVLTTTNNW